MRSDLIKDSITFIRENFSRTSSFLTYPRHGKNRIISQARAEPEEVITSLPRSGLKTEKPSTVPKALPKSKEESFLKEDTPLKTKLTLPFTELSTTVQRLFPYLAVKKTPLDDGTAFFMANPLFMKGLESDVVIFSFEEDKKSEAFLKNLESAIVKHHTTGFLFPVSSCKNEEALALFLQKMEAEVVIAPLSLMQKKPFFPFIKEIPAGSKRFLNKSTLLLLEPFAEYFNHPEKKKALWTTVCNLLKNRNTQA